MTRRRPTTRRQYVGHAIARAARELRSQLRLSDELSPVVVAAAARHAALMVLIEFDPLQRVGPIVEELQNAELPPQRGRRSRGKETT